MVSRGDLSPGGTDGEGPDVRAHSPDPVLDLRGRHIPKEQSLFRIASTDQPGAVRTEGQGRHNAGVRQRRTRLAGRRVPEADGVVPTPGGDPAAVGAVPHWVDVAGVAGEDGQGGL